MTYAPIMGTIEPDMGTTNVGSPVASVLFGKVRTAVLALLLDGRCQEFYLREIVRATDSGQGAVQRELGRLVGAGLVTRTRRGRQVFYRGNAESPIFGELRTLIAKTVGSTEVLRRHLAGVADRINVAFIYGSIARGMDAPASDIDLFVVGELDPSEVYEALWPAREELGREIDARVFPPREFRARLESEDHFIKSVMSEPKLFVIGEADDLGKLGEPGQDRPTGKA